MAIIRLMQLALATLFCASAPLLFAQPPVVEGEDLSFLKPLSDSTLIRYEQLDNSRFAFPAGKVKKIGGLWQAENERVAQGRLSSLTYRISERYRVDQVLEFFEAQLVDLGARELYRCSGLSCGNSNKWANIVFDEKRLYGPHTNQRYVLSEYASGTLSLYLIKRGNKRVYARVDYIQSSATESQGASDSVLSWVAQLKTNGTVTLDEPSSLLATSNSTRLLEELASWLIESNRSIYLVVHRYGNLPVDELLEAATKQAERFSNRLQASGVSSANIRPFAVGPLAPSENANANRMTIMTIDTNNRVGR